MKLSEIITRRYRVFDRMFESNSEFQNNVITYMHIIRSLERSRDHLDSYVMLDNERRKIHSNILSAMNCQRCGRNNGIKPGLQCGSSVCTCTLFGLWIESLMNN